MSTAKQDRRSDQSVREDAIAWLSRLRSNDAPQDHDAFETWYSASPRHAAIYDEVLGNWERMALAVHAPAGAVRGGGRLSFNPLAWPKPIMAAAAVILIAICLGLGVQWLGSIRPPASQTMMIASKLGDIRTVTLADGSRVTLDTLSRVKMVYSQGQRLLVLEQGRARFDVAHEGRPFMVVAAGSMVIAHGTMFDVALKDGALSVALLRGSVEVTQARQQRIENTTSGLFLKPGQRISIRGNVVAGTPAGLNADEIEWPSGTASFENATLAAVVATANGYSRQRIVLEGEALGDLRFSGSVRIQDTAGIARLLAATFDLNLVPETSGALVLTKR